jgi:hypothetical protein
MEYKAGLIVRELFAVESSAFIRFSFDLSIWLALHTRHCSFSKNCNSEQVSRSKKLEFFKGVPQPGSTRWLIVKRKLKL